MARAGEIDARGKTVGQVAQEVAQYLQREADRVLIDITDNMVVPEMKDYINTEWYRDGESGTPYYTSLGEMSKIYKRLYANTKDNYVVVGYATDELPVDSAPLTTFFNRPEGIQKFANRNNYWPSYISIVDGEDMREDMPYVIEYGWSITGLIDSYLSNYGNKIGRQKRPGIYAHSYLKKFLEDNFGELVKRAFRKKGFKVIR